MLMIAHSCLKTHAWSAHHYSAGVSSVQTVTGVAQVREGAVEAPGMDAEAELRTLRARFDNFRRDFKLRLEATGELLKRAEREERRSARRGSRDSRGGLGLGSGVGSGATAGARSASARRGWLARCAQARPAVVCPPRALGAGPAAAHHVSAFIRCACPGCCAWPAQVVLRLAAMPWQLYFFFSACVCYVAQGSTTARTYEFGY